MKPRTTQSRNTDMLMNFRSRISIPKRFAIWFGVNALTYFFLCAVLKRYEIAFLFATLGTFLVFPIWFTSAVFVPDFFTRNCYVKSINFVFLILFIASLPIFLVAYQQGRIECGCDVPRHRRLLAEFAAHQMDFQRLVDLGKLTESINRNYTYDSQGEQEIIRGFTKEQLSEWNKLVSVLPKQFDKRRIERKQVGAKFEYWFWRYQFNLIDVYKMKVFVYSQNDLSLKKNTLFDADYKFLRLNDKWYLHTSQGD
jgi:hypothetical protein